MYERLRKKMKELGVSTNRLALMSNIAPADLYTALSGKKPLYPEWKRRISEALEVSEEELFYKEK